MHKIQKAIAKEVNSNCDYYSIPRKEQQKILDETLDNVMAVANDPRFDIYAVVEQFTKGVLPRRGRDNKTGKPGSLQSMLDYIKDLHTSKYVQGDMSGRQLTGFNHINEVLANSEIYNKVKLPHMPTVVIDAMDKSQILYTVQGKDRHIEPKVYHMTATTGNGFFDLFGFENEQTG